MGSAFGIRFRRVGIPQIACFREANTFTSLITWTRAVARGAWVVSHRKAYKLRIRLLLSQRVILYVLYIHHIAVRVLTGHWSNGSPYSGLVLCLDSCVALLRYGFSIIERETSKHTVSGTVLSTGARLGVSDHTAVSR